LQPETLSVVSQTAAVYLIGVDINDRAIVCSFQKIIAAGCNRTCEVNMQIAAIRKTSSCEINRGAPGVMQFDPFIIRGGMSACPGDLVDDHSQWREDDRLRSWCWGG
jgi:hypothetical protein